MKGVAYMDRKRKSEEIYERVWELANYTADYHSTVRATAQAYYLSKSTVHKDLTDRLPIISPLLYEQVRKVLDENKSERHIRGGMATKRKYQNLKR